MTNAVSYDCLEFMKYRFKHIPKKDTFLSTIYKHTFCFGGNKN